MEIAGGDTTAFGVTDSGGSAGSSGPSTPGGPGGGNGTKGNGGNGTQVPGFHPFYVGLTDENVHVSGLANQCSWKCFTVVEEVVAPSPTPFTPGLGGGGNSRSFNNDYKGVDGFGGGGSQTQVSMVHHPSL